VIGVNTYLLVYSRTRPQRQPRRSLVCRKWKKRQLMLEKKSRNSSVFRARVQKVLRFEIRDIDPTTRASPGAFGQWTNGLSIAIFVLDECNGEIFECAQCVVTGVRERYDFAEQKFSRLVCENFFAPLYPYLFLCAISPVRVSCQWCSGRERLSLSLFFFHSLSLSLSFFLLHTHTYIHAHTFSRGKDRKSFRGGLYKHL